MKTHKRFKVVVEKDGTFFREWDFHSRTNAMAAALVQRAIFETKGHTDYSVTMYYALPIVGSVTRIEGVDVVAAQSDSNRSGRIEEDL